MVLAVVVDGAGAGAGATAVVVPAAASAARAETSASARPWPDSGLTLLGLSELASFSSRPNPVRKDTRSFGSEVLWTVLDSDHVRNCGLCLSWNLRSV